MCSLVYVPLCDRVSAPMMRKMLYPDLTEGS